MAIRPPGSYVTKKKGSKKGKSRQKENKFARKKFFNLTTQTPFPVSTHGQTCNTRLRSKQDLRPMLIGRTFSVNQGDLLGDNKDTHRNFKFRVGEVRGNDCISYFDGMYISQDKISGMVRKWHSLVEAEAEFSSKDGSTWRFFVAGVTRRRPENTSRTSYLKASEVKRVRKIMLDVLTREVEGLDTDKLLMKLSNETIGKAIEAECAEIYPMTVILRKVKALKNVRIADVKNLPSVAAVQTEEPNTFEVAVEN